VDVWWFFLRGQAPGLIIRGAYSTCSLLLQAQIFLCIEIGSNGIISIAIIFGGKVMGK
jgi:hypothetical protein